MTAAASGPSSEPVLSDPESIRAALTVTLRGEFDREWNVALDEAKVSKRLGPIHDLLNKWRHIAAGEAAEPGRYYRALAKAEQILRTGSNPEAGSMDEIRALINSRVGR